MSVALPAHREGPLLGRAAGAILAQTHRDLELLIVLNAADGATRDAALSVAAEDGRVRVLERTESGLAGALNFAFREARHGLVARMDADDTCDPERLQRQLARLAAEPDLAGVGTSCRRVLRSGEPIDTTIYPAEADEIRWRLFLGNYLCHGSMLLRREAVLTVGGYAESLVRAQDYDLWLRMSLAGFRLANVSEPLYTYTLPDDRRAHEGVSSREQGEGAAQALLRAWERLGSADAGTLGELAPLLTLAHGDAANAAAAAPMIGDVLTRRGPSREGLLAYLLATSRAGSMPPAALRTCKRSRLREVGQAMRRTGVDRVILYGAGAHTGFVLDHAAELGVPVAGIIDDRAAGEWRHGFVVAAPSSVAPGEHVLLSSDWHEDALWDAAAPLRDRGVRVWLLYTERDA